MQEKEQARHDLRELVRLCSLPPDNPSHKPPHVALVELAAEMQAVKNDVSAVKHRNKRVEAEKDWDTSVVRIGIICAMTYCVISLYMFAVDIDRPWLNAIVPTIGFQLSTWSLPGVRRLFVLFVLDKQDRAQGQADPGRVSPV